MKMTFDIDDGLMRRLREEAARRGMTPSALLEAEIMYRLAKPVACDKQSGDLPPLPTWQSGGFRIDITNRDELYRVMEEE